MRFDNLSAMRTKYPKELGELTWANVYDRLDLQILALTLQMKEGYIEYRKYTDPYNALAFADASYNGGMSGLNLERRACKMSSTCDPNIWFDNVEKFCMKSKTPLYGNRSACDINRDHTRDVLIKRSSKYIKYF